MQTCIARQPIFDREKNVYGYELLFRSGTENIFCGMEGDRASATLMHDLMHLHSVDKLTNGHKCFINVTPRILLEGLYTVLPKETTVLEVLENIELDDELIAACRQLRQAGYQLALDDYALESKFEPLLPLLNVLKVEFNALDELQRREIVALSRKYEFKLLAEKIESPQDLEHAKRLNYHYFQGFFFCRPEMVQNRAMPTPRQSSLRLLQQLNEPALNIDELEKIIRHDVTLSYKLLKYLNSAAFAFRHKITSIRHGLALLGDKQIRKWGSVVILSNLGSGKPSELLRNGMIRARFCESLAGPTGLNGRDSDLFMTGLFSILDALLDKPLSDVVSELPLHPDVRGALVGEPTTLRAILDLAIVFEAGKWPDVVAAAQLLELTEATIGQAFHDAMFWADELLNEMSGEVAATSGNTKLAG